MLRTRSPYRIGRRLKASRRGRLNYITYLNSDGMPTRVDGDVPEGGGPILRRLAARFTMGGASEATIAVAHLLGAVLDLGGAMRANIFPPVTLKPRFDLGGMMAAKIGGIPRVITAKFAGGGSMDADIQSLPQVMLKGTFALGGAFVAGIDTTKRLGMTFAGGGAMSMSGALKRRLRAVNALGGSMDAGIDGWYARLKATFTNGGTFSAAIRSNTAPITFIDQTALVVSETGQTVTIPGGAQAGDLLILALTSARQNISAPSLFTQVGTTTAGTTTGDYDHIRLSLFSRILAPGFASTISVADSGAEVGTKLFVFRGADAVDMGSGFPATSSNTVTSGQVATVVEADTACFQVAAYGMGNQGTVTWSSADASFVGGAELSDETQTVNTYYKVGMASWWGRAPSAANYQMPNAVSTSAATFRILMNIMLRPA